MKTPLYSVAALGPTAGCSVSRAAAINDKGLVIGHSHQENVDEEVACLWEGGRVHDLGRIRVNTINNKGQIVGCRLNAPLSFRAVLCDNRQPQNLFQNNSAVTNAQGINDAGQVVGYALAPPAKWKTPADIKRGAFLWERGKRRYLQTPPGYRAVGATAINSQGTVVGNVWLPGTDDERNHEHAVVWQAGAVKLLGEPQGFHSTQAEAVNDLGLILVWAKILTILSKDTYECKQQSYLWRDGQWQVIEGMGLAHSLNNRGQVVGWIGIEPKAAPGANEHGDVHAAVWEAGEVMDLNDVLPTASGWMLKRATGINNPGQIVGDGVYRGKARAFLLTPIT